MCPKSISIAESMEILSEKSYKRRFVKPCSMFIIIDNDDICIGKVFSLNISLIGQLVMCIWLYLEDFGDSKTIFVRL